MTYKEIEQVFLERTQRSNYSFWTVGVTDNPNERENQHTLEKGRIKSWTHCPTDNESIGRDIEKHFIALGMQGGTGGGGTASYVYIFQNP